MLDDLRRAIDSAPAGTHPFALWREGIADDFQTTFIELWAYLADILTFYQERIANEAYLPTATQRDSLVRLAALTGYTPPPGSSATVLEAFTVDPGKTLTIPLGFRTASKPAPGASPAVFETSGTINARGEHSAIPIATVTPLDQFAALAGPGSFEVVLVGTNLRLAVGDFLLLVEFEGDPGETRTLRQFSAVTTNPVAQTTTIAWSEEGPGFVSPNLYALRVSAAPFGHNAPAWASLPPSLRFATSPAGPAAPPFPDNWDNPVPGPFYLPIPGDTLPEVFLDSVRPQAGGTPDDPGWVVLLTDLSGDAPGGMSVLQNRMIYSVFPVIDARPVSKAALAVGGRVTRLTFSTDPNSASLPASTFPLRSTLILTGAEALTVADTVPAADPLTGQALVLSGLYPNLQPGLTAILVGPVPNSNTAAPGSQTAAEAIVFASIGPPDTVNSLTPVVLQSPLSNLYTTAGSVVLANVSTATHGETVRDEILGSGDGSPFQTFTLKKGPLTYLPASQADGSAAVQSTLDVTVNGVLWQEVATLYGNSADAQVYTAAIDESGASVVRFGDGTYGACPPTGQDNIRARYRRGLGTAGNVGTGLLAQLLDNQPGLKSVSNPFAATGGADPAQIDQIRTFAPSVGRVFGRAVSVADYEALSLGYPGVSKASASWSPPGAVGGGSAGLPAVMLTIATQDQTPLASQPAFARAFRAYLDLRRDPNIPLRLLDYTPVFIEVSAVLDISDRYPRTATLTRALSALRPGPNSGGAPGFFAFERLKFGQSITLASIYSALQAVPGVRDATITTFRRLDQDLDPSTVRNAILVGPTELPTIVDDHNNPSQGTLTLTLGSGGFVDS
jgi:predicted phage baseplate assembly protein